MKNTKNQPKEVSKMTNVDMNVNVNVNVNKNTVICVAIVSGLVFSVYLASGFHFDFNSKHLSIGFNAAKNTAFGFSKADGLRIISNPELLAKSLPKSA